MELGIVEAENGVYCCCDRDSRAGVWFAYDVRLVYGGVGQRMKMSLHACTGI